MVVFMLVLLAAISLIITFVGLFLSSRTSAQAEEHLRLRRSTYSVTVGLDRRPRQVNPTIPYRAQRITYSEPVGWSWSSFWQMFAITRLVKRRPSDPTPWAGLIIIMLGLFWMGLLLLHTIAPAVTLAAFGWGNSAMQSSSSSKQNAPAPQYNVSQKLARISQLDPAQYTSQQQFDLWAYSTCSTAAMTEVLNAYGNHYRVADILKVEAQIGEITPSQGLLEDRGIARTVAYFGFKTSWGYNLSLNQIISIANKGEPVIVSWPPSRYPAGHLVVVTGGNSSTVDLADSSIYNRHTLSRAQFMKWWGGFSAVVTPN